MTHDEAVKWLDNLKNDIGNPHYEGLWPYAQAIDEIMCLLEEQEGGMNEWISVNDKLPELNQRVLVYAVGKIDGFIGEHTIQICGRFIQRIFPSSPGQEIWSSPYQYFHTDYEITHWMPLPKPPNEEGELE